jgi:hypothetical protein
MTFIPSVLTKIDDNNTTTQTSTSSYTGTGTLTTGYNSVIVTLSSDENSNPGGLEIQYSSDNIDGLYTTFYNDTYFTGTKFTKTYKIINKYYRIKYTIGGSANYTITSRLNVDESPEQSNANNIYSLPQDGMYDAFGKLRVTNPLTLLDIKFPSASTGTAEYLSNSMLECNSSSGFGTATYGSSKCVMTVNGGTGTFISQSRKYCIYQPGKSLLFLGSGIIGPTGINSTNYTNRLGYFDDENGLFFENNTGTLNIVLRNSTVDTSISQSNWNIDKFNGTGNSGITLDFTKSQLFVIDFEWLSVGRIRYGFYIYGKIFYCHQITNVNYLTDPYMLTPNLPIRFEVRNNSISGTTTLTQICSSVISEGGYNPLGKPFTASNGVTGISVTLTETPLLAIRGLSGTYNHQNILPSNLNILTTGSKDTIYYLRLYLAPNAPTVTTWFPVNNNSVTEYALGGTNITITGGTSIIVDSVYISNQSTITFQSLTNIFTNFIQITSNISNISDVLLISAQKLTAGTDSVYASINWTESY